MSRRVRILLAVIMILSLVLGPMSGLCSAVTEATVITLTIGSPTMTVNGVPQPIDAGGTTPVIIGGRTLLPIRAVVEAIGGTIEWNAATRTVTITAKAVTMSLTIGNRMATVNGTKLAIDPQNPSVVPVIVGGRTMLPLRFVGEQLGGIVDWDGTTRTATLTFAAPVPLTAPTLLGPAEGTLLTSTTVELRWSAVTGATSYIVAISDATNQEVFRGISTSTSLIPSTGVLGTGRFSWAVAAARGIVVGTFSLPRSFTIKLPLSPTEIVKKTAPAIAAILALYPDGSAAIAAAFSTASDGVFVTTYGIIKGAVDGRIVLADDTQIGSLRVLGYDPESDIAVLTAETDKQIEPLTLAAGGAIQINQDVVAVGPVLRGIILQEIVTGVVNGITPTGFTIRGTTENAVAGAPVVDQFGEVIGMVTTLTGSAAGSFPAVSAGTIKAVATTGNWTLAQVTEREGTDPEALVAPTPVDPGADMTVPTLTPVLRWNRVQYATQYEVAIHVNGRGSDTPIARGIVSNTTAQVAPGCLRTGLTYEWIVRAGNDRGWGPWSAPRLFMVSSSIDQPASPVLLEPQNNAVVKAASPLLCWQAIPHIPRYFIRVAVATGDIVFEDSTDQCFISIPDDVLTSETTYVWFVRAESSSEISSLWSFENRFHTIFPSSLGVPSLVSPLPSEMITALNPTFIWQPVSAATSYRLRIDVKTASIAGTTVFEQVVTGTSFVLPPDILQPGLTYTWYVIAGNASGWSKTGDTWNWSLERTFSVSTAASLVLVPPILIDPPMGVVVDSLTPVLTWESVPVPAWYRLYIGQGTSENHLVPVLNQVIMPVAGKQQRFAVPPGILAPHTMYYWQVFAGSGLDMVTSSFGSFTTP